MGNAALHTAPPSSVLTDAAQTAVVGRGALTDAGRRRWWGGGR